MIKLPRIFASGALYLHSAPLEIRGSAEGGADLTARILRAGEVLSEGKATADGAGDFVLPLRTPKASLLPCEIELSDGKETLTLTDILFGEVWLACGQSNMEMANLWQPEWETVVQKGLCGKAIRVFTAPRLPHDGAFPIDPDPYTDGWWVTSEDFDKMKGVSALATSFSIRLYEYFCEKGEEIPVGFYNCSRGATCIETWLPAESFSRYPEIADLAPDRESWNQKGEMNFRQPSAHYNLNTHPHLGIKARGMLWYQGETNLAAEQRRSVYRTLLVALRESYAERFSPSADEPFPIVSSQIYPWRYSGESDAYVGYFNRIFSELAEEDPRRYPFVPLCDLPPIWLYHAANSPIHPAHKLALGERFAYVVENLLYGGEGQVLPATLRSCVRHGGRLRLTFSRVGSGLYLKDGTLRGLYLRSDKGAYVPAKCEIEGKRVLWVWAEGVCRPRHVAYAVSSHEVETTLMAGALPVAPFCTEFSETVRSVTIDRKPWLSLSLDGDFAIAPRFAAPVRDAGHKPTVYPLGETALSYDPSTLGRRGLRVEGLGEGAFGIRIPARVGAELDLQNYASLSVTVYNAAQLTASLVLEYAETEGRRLTLSLSPAASEPLPFGCARLTFDLTELPSGMIERLSLSFTKTAGTVSVAVLADLSLTARA